MNENDTPSSKKENIQTTQNRKQEIKSQILTLNGNKGLQIPHDSMKALRIDSTLRIRTKNQSQNGLEKALKIKLSDVEFQRKKIEEDFYLFKRNAKIEKNREVKQWEDAYHQLKTSYTEAIQDSLQINNRVKQQHKKQLSQLRQKYERKMKSEIDSLEQNYEKKLKTQAQIYEKDLIYFQEKLVKESTLLYEQFQKKLREEKQKFQNQINEIHQKSKEELKNKEKQYEGICLAFQSEKKTEQKLHLKTKFDSFQIQQKLQSELLEQKNIKNDLEHELKVQQLLIKNLKTKINDLEGIINDEKQIASKRLKDEREDYEKKISDIYRLHSEEKSQDLQKHSQQLSGLHKKVADIQSQKNDKEFLLEEKISLVEEKFNQRPSRKQDLQAIDDLMKELNKRDQQTKLLKEELKNFAREVENREQSYDRMFVSTCLKTSKKRQPSFAKKFLSIKRRNDLEVLFQRSRTAALKFYLPVPDKYH